MLCSVLVAEWKLLIWSGKGTSLELFTTVHLSKALTVTPGCFRRFVLSKVHCASFSAMTSAINEQKNSIISVVYYRYPDVTWKWYWNAFTILSFTTFLMAYLHLYVMILPSSQTFDLKMCKSILKCIFFFLCLHLADAFIQMNLHCIQGRCLCQFMHSLRSEPRTLLLLAFFLLPLIKFFRMYMKMLWKMLKLAKMTKLVTL